MFAVSPSRDSLLLLTIDDEADGVTVGAVLPQISQLIYGYLDAL